jgi:predicted nucleic acid-binding protein
VVTAFDLDRLLRRLKPERRIDRLERRPDEQLVFVEDEPAAGPPLLLDTCVYLHVLKGRTPGAVDRLIATRTLVHSATAVSELSHGLGRRRPASPRETAARGRLAEAIRSIPAHRVVTPTAEQWLEAGILAGLMFRLCGLQAGAEQTHLNDALMLTQARDTGTVVLTANVGDFDLLQQLVPATRTIFYRAS